MENNKLCEIKTNIVNWYNFKKNLSILQINASEVEISKYLNDVSNSKLTIAYQNDEEKNKINSEVKCNTILIDNLENREEFDYVCLIGTLNVYKKDEKAYKKLNELMKIAKENCKPDGTIILVLDNKYGMKFWTSIYANKNILCNDKFALSITIIEEILDPTLNLGSASAKAKIAATSSGDFNIICTLISINLYSFYLTFFLSDLFLLNNKFLSFSLISLLLDLHFLSTIFDSDGLVIVIFIVCIISPPFTN